MKPREPRQKVMISARMRTGASWNDACILNVSSGGMLIQAADAPQRGAYLELRRGPVAVTARVMWTQGHRCGLKTQDPLPIATLLNPSAQAVATDQPEEDRRNGQRAPDRIVQDRHDRSRYAGRMMEFACVALFAVLACIIAAGAVEGLFARPLSTIQQSLAGNGDGGAR